MADGLIILLFFGLMCVIGGFFLGWIAREMD